jgi:hypothetical protein
MKKIRLLFAMSLLAILPSATTAKAALIPWGYDWTATPSFVTAGTGKVTLTNETPQFAVGESIVVATALKAISTANPLTPDTFGAGDGNYSLTIKLTDSDSGLFGTLTFTGKLSGSFSALSSNVTNTFTGLTTQQLLLGSTLFTVKADAFTPPGPPNQGNLGSISFKVTPTATTPEPATLTIALLGVGCAALVSRRNRRPPLAML